MEADSGLLSPVRAGTAAEAATSDRAWLRAMLEAEAALARAQARAGTVPARAARVIGQVAATTTVDPAHLARVARQAANPVVPLVAELRRAVRAVDPRAARHVHQGATSQDILDTAAMLVARRAVGTVLDGLDRTAAGLAGLAETHRDTLMAARTLGQHAVPTTFGLKAATWLAGLLQARDRLRSLRLPAQLGGAAGTLAAFGLPTPGVPPGPESSAELSDLGELGELGDPARVLGLAGLFAEELGLDAPGVPWHAERSVIAELGTALAGAAGALGKIATDVILLAQTEVGEVAESSGGRSSAMPHKRNPALSVLVRSAALQVPAYAQVLACAPLAEHERAVGAWQAEWQPLRECLRLTGGAAETAAELVAGLQVFPERMRANADLTGGRLVSERLAAHLGRDVLDRASGRPEPLPETLAGRVPEELFDPQGYLGACGALIDRVLTGYRSVGGGADGKAP
ncbi:putative 3-carboxymuconate cycloisomerase (PcaB) [Planobispora rosea]|uniref:Putative 3-carboxymuconate cycloisomerase (PcaB) n=1 Tax=Planobispora rosea TaxID=35762 RepID=A0A8J3S220_PLARO|nr:lyase family protein [Planobispora rosea]GGS63468.1 putative 3-carboxymuconate cycloisomerase (PcaB) [Planobispora rosea]GIH84471.1 putative 3-carboxymuconate cycloisomerase (PcaB) [Planobispora rosea]